ncbi:MAG TPA: extracellular solute-binding protein [Xanthobacteraceae bacterium]|nr:extracellular solute-binding protein [Xanthobacteraceae bacterium]
MRATRRIVLGAMLATMSFMTPSQAAWQDSPEVKALYEKAKAEGKVVVWGTQQGEVDWIPAAFGKLFPGIQVEWVGDNDIATKAIAEARGGRHQIDVFWHSLTGVTPLVQRDLLAKTDWTTFGIPASNVTFDGRAAFTSNMAYALAFNSDKVKKEDVPTRWDAMTDPKYKGQLTASLFLLPRLSGGLSLAWGLDKAETFVRGLHQNNILMTRAPREPIINAGERLFGVGEVDSLVRRWGRSGLKIDYVIPEPVVMGQFVATVMAKAPNPNAARLLAGFLATPEGKAAREAVTSAGDYSPAGTGDFAKLVNSGKLEVVRDTPDNMAQREKAITSLGPIVAGQR